MEFMVSADRVTYSYPIYDESGSEIARHVAIDDATIRVRPGEFVALLGRNGSGKSTFARMVNALIVPEKGEMRTLELSTADENNTWKIRQAAGEVFQNPDNQIIASIVEEDVAFGPENLGFAPAKICENVERSLQSVHLAERRKESPNRMSGGQKQRVAVAGILAMEPDCIVMDESTAMLDPMGRREVMETIETLHARGMTVVYITHHMDEACRADRIVVIEKGKPVLEGTPKELFSDAMAVRALGLDVPQAAALAQYLRREGLPISNEIMTVEALAEAIAALPAAHADYVLPKAEPPKRPTPVLEVKHLSHAFEVGTAFEKLALDDVSFGLGKGEFVGIIGHTGSGKSTLISHLNALEQPTSGEVCYEGHNIFEKDAKALRKLIRQKVGLVFQYPEHQLFEMTVYKDVAFGPTNMGLSKEEVDERVRWALSCVGLDETGFEKSPFDLSGGQKRRVAIAGVLAMRPEFLILDEPVAGLDPAGRDELYEQLRVLHQEHNITVIVVSHSMEDMARYAKRLLVLDHGKLLYDTTPTELFGQAEAVRAIGLDVPEMVKLANALRKKGVAVPAEVINVRGMKTFLNGMYLPKGGAQ